MTYGNLPMIVNLLVLLPAQQKSKNTNTSEEKPGIVTKVELIIREAKCDNASSDCNQNRSKLRTLLFQVAHVLHRFFK